LLGRLRLLWFVDLGDAKTEGPNLSLNLHHAREFQPDYHHLMTAAPAAADIPAFMYDATKLSLITDPH
jgi:hypothetical protein